MFNKRSLMKLVVDLLMMLLALQPIVHAGGSNSLVNGLLAAVATVVTGGGYLAAAVIGVAVGTQPSNPGGGTNTGRGGVQDYRVELSTFDGDQSEPASILIKLKDSVSGNYLIEGLPAGVSLYVRHSDPGTFLVEGYEPPSAASVDSSDNFIDVSACPRVSAVGIPSEIRYVVKSQSQSVRMDVINSSGSVVYSLTESSPSPAKPIPFVWKGTDIDGKGVSAGTYSVRLNAVKNDGAEESAPIQIMNIRNIINAGVEYEITSFSGGTATVRVWPPIDGSAATDIVTVSLWQGDRLISSANQTVNFAGGVLTEPTIAQNSLNFALTMTSNIDGVPVKITIPGADDSSKNIKMIVNEGRVEQTNYEYDPINGTVYLDGSTYTSSKADVYYGILKMMESIGAQVFGQGGVSYDKDNNDLKIDISKFANKSGIASDYKVDISKDTNTISITVSKGPNSVTSTYDLNDNKVTLPADFTWAGDFNWDLTSSNLALIEGPSTAGVKVMSGDLSFIGESRKILATLNKTLFAAVLVKEYLKVTKPMDRPVEPDITDITWYSRTAKAVTVKGTAGGVLPHIYITNGSTSREATGVSYSGGIWSVNISLANGENKINAVVKTADGREVESGDATVYIGANGRPDLILVSPRDRQVFWSGDISKNSEISIPNQAIKGTVSSGTNVKFKGQSLLINSDGSFNSAIILSLKEGENNKEVEFGGATITKTIIGAYKFINDVKPSAFVLRRGDFMFSNKGIGGFDVIPAEPDHIGVYLGGKKVVDPVMTGIEEHDLSVRDKNNYYYGKGFYYATQIPMLADESKREAVIDKIKPYIGTEYDLPINLLTFKGHYDGADNGKFYCSELAYWAWNQVAGSNIGINLVNIMYPFRGINDPSNSLLPAYFLEETMKVKEVAK